MVTISLFDVADRQQGWVFHLPFLFLYFLVQLRVKHLKRWDPIILFSFLGLTGWLGQGGPHLEIDGAFTTCLARHTCFVH
jgi:hypothetical protein